MGVNTPVQTVSVDEFEDRYPCEGHFWHISVTGPIPDRDYTAAIFICQFCNSLMQIRREDMHKALLGKLDHPLRRVYYPYHCVMAVVPEAVLEMDKIVDRDFPNG